jgi:hypothetical protein
MSDLIFYGGLNWLGYAIFDEIVKSNKIIKFIIIDNFSNYLDKDNIKIKFDNYKHLYNVDLFLYNINIKDKDKLKDIYNQFNINYCIINIKYNIYSSFFENKDKINGYKNINNLNKTYNVSNVIGLIRTISHNCIYLNTLKKNIVEYNNNYNNIFLNIFHNSVILEIKDYVYGDKKDKYNNIIETINTIIRTKSPIPFIHGNTFLTKDTDIINCILSFIIDKKKTKITYINKTYNDLFNKINL